MANLLSRIANYFKEWDGVDETAPKMELSIHDLRDIASMHTEKCKAELSVKSFKNRFFDGVKVHYQGLDDSDGIECPICGHEVARIDDFAEMRPKHCPECGTKLVY